MAKNAQEIPKGNVQQLSTATEKESFALKREECYDGIDIACYPS